MSEQSSTRAPLAPPSSRAELEFRRFAGWVAADCGENERRLLALLVRRFMEYSPLGTAHGRRAHWILQGRSETQGEDIAAAIDAAATGTKDVFPFERLVRLQVGPFRGFAHAEPIDLERPVTLIYGPNGTGKSSLCEALEYAMLGFIEEAKSRRIELGDYVKHVPSGEVEAPELVARTEEGDEFTVKADAEAYRFCFIEKNRIDAFARMSATTPAAQAHRIASLFGLEEFNHFVDGFTDNFDRYLDLVPVKPVELQQLEQLAEAHRATVVASADQLADVSRRRELLAANARLGVPFADLASALFGDDQAAQVGRLAAIDEELESVAPHQREDLEAADGDATRSTIGALETRLAAYKAAASAVLERTADVSFSRLFEAVQGLGDSWTDPSCPACLTPLDQVVVDPRLRAEEGLAQLAELAELEVAQAAARRELTESVQVASRRFGSLDRLALDLIEVEPLPSLDGLAAQIAAADPDAFHALEGAVQAARDANDDLDRLDTARQAALDALAAYEEHRRTLRTERERLRAVATDMARLEAEEAQVLRARKEAAAALEGLNARRARLQWEIAEEGKRIERDQSLLAAYESLIGLLRGYRDMLPIVLVEDLGEKSLEIYNQINAHDPPFDLLDELVLPQKVGDDLLVRFSGSQQHVNALHLLSEGHLRCLGVAILLAKSLDEECGLVVFDDVVNAVDDEHRVGLATVLMRREDISEKQIIITTHGLEFIRVLSHQVPKKDFASRVGQIDFRVPTDKRGVVVDRDATPEHYLVRSALRIKEGKWRDALGDHRRALEAVCARLWKRLAAKYNVQLKVTLRSLAHPPDLRSVVDALRGFLKKEVSKAEDDLAAEMVEHFDVLVARWDELNKATHEEEGQKEFEAVTVQEIQDALEELESKIAQRWKEL